MNKAKSILILLSCTFNTYANAQKRFGSLDELLDYAQKKNIGIQQSSIKIRQAQKAKLAAAINLIDPVITTNSSFTNNTQLPINLFPAEVFGGQPGTFREVQSGVQYVTNLNQYGDIKLLNLGALENLKLAKINIESVSTDNKITLKNLYDNITSSYYNILNLQEQIIQNKENINTSDSLLRIAQKKYEQGIVKQQDVNDAQATYLNTQENTHQLEFLLKQNELNLKILCDIPETENIQITHDNEQKMSIENPNILFNDLNVKSNLLKEKYAISNYRQYKKGQLPTLALFASNTFQQNNTEMKLFDNNTNWIKSNYVGLKLSFNLPSAQSISQIYNAQYEYQLAQKNTEHAKIKADLDYEQLKNDYQKARSQANANAEIYKLRKDTYEKNQQLYIEGLIGIDQTINSYNAMVNAHYNFISSQINVQLTLSKIDINNKIN